jgi:hypothetical protein
MKCRRFKGKTIVRMLGYVADTEAFKLAEDADASDGFLHVFSRQITSYAYSS